MSAHPRDSDSWTIPSKGRFSMIGARVRSFISLIKGRRIFDAGFLTADAECIKGCVEIIYRLNFQRFNGIFFCKIHGEVSGSKVRFVCFGMLDCFAFRYTKILYAA